MKSPHILSKVKKQNVAAALMNGAAAFFRFDFFQVFSPVPFASAKLAKSDALYNLLPKKHYFRRELAKWPPSVAVRI